MLIAGTAQAACQNAACLKPSILLSPFELNVGPGGLSIPSGEDTLKSPERAAQDTFAALEFGRADKSDTSDEIGYSSYSTGLTVGQLWSLGEDKVIGVSASHERARLHSNDGLSRANGRFSQLDLVLVRQAGDWQLSGSMSLAYSQDKARRHLSRNDSRVGVSRSESYFALAGFGLTRRFGQDDRHIEAGLSLAAIYQYTPSYRESGLGSDNLRVQSSQDLKVMISPSIEYSRRLTIHGFDLSYSLSGGLIFLPDRRWSMRGSTAGDPGTTLKEYATMPSVIGSTQAGLMLSGNGNWSLSVDYSLQIASGYRAQSGSLTATWKF